MSAESHSRRWWRRALAAAKDEGSVMRVRFSSRGYRAEMEAAVIRATSHDERSVDYRNAARVFAWARASPTFRAPLLRALSRRARRTRSWVVTLKTLLLVHGVLLSAPTPTGNGVGRLPFDLSDFRGRPGFHVLVRAYYRFLDCRYALLSDGSNADDISSSSFLSSYSSSSKFLPTALSYSSALSNFNDLEKIEKMQEILDILVQIRPYADGMEVGLILEAMDCALIEIFEVYSCICSAIASFLVTVLGPSSSAEERRRKGVAWMKILRRAAEQSKRLSAYFDLCRTLGVINASLIPSIETVPEEDIRDLEDFVLGGFHGMIDTGRSESVLVMTAAENKNWEEPSHRQPGTVVSNEWVLFEDIKPSPPRTPPYSVLSYGNPFLCLDDDEKKTVVTRLSWAAAV